MDEEEFVGVFGRGWGESEGVCNGLDGVYGGVSCCFDWIGEGRKWGCPKIFAVDVFPIIIVDLLRAHLDNLLY